MLDRDLAELYQVRTMDLNKAMKRNIERFPEDFAFRLNKSEFNKKWELSKENRKDGHITYRLRTSDRKIFNFFWKWRKIEIISLKIF